MSKKSAVKVRKIRKIKKSHSWITIFIVLFFHIATACLILVFGEIFFGYFVQTKVDKGISSVMYLAGLYQYGIEKGSTDKVFEMLDSTSDDYIVRDRDGNIIHQFGDNTIGDEGHEIVTDISFKRGPVSAEIDTTGIGYELKETSSIMYADTRTDYLNITEDGVTIKLKKLYAALFDEEAYGIKLEDDMTDEEAKELIDKKLDDFEEQSSDIIGINVDSRIHLPFWTSVSVNDGKEEFVGKAYINFKLSDIVFIILFLSLIIIMGFFILMTILIYIISNIVNQRRTKALLFTDMATGGHNWTWFFYKGEQLLRRFASRKNKYAVVNLVFVKYRNYCVCHSIEQGEKMLKLVEGFVKKEIDKKDMVAHVSNSNFAILMKYEDEDQLKMKLQSMILGLERIDPGHVFTFQAGVALIGVEVNNRGSIVRRKVIDLDKEYNDACTARATLAENDESGVAFFDNKLVEDQKWIDTVVERQKYAIENEEFAVYYQPKYDPVTNKLKGAEALVRWINDDMGFVPPGKFIPIFEKNGFITEIDHYMLEHVARDQKAWLDKGLQCVPVSVNVSRAHFIESDLAEQIRDIVDKAGAPHKYIEIELTESAFFDDKKALITTITKLKEYGFTVSMDDFGSGYSSLNSLKDMPLDVLKLDAEFFRGDNQGERGEIVVSEAIKLAKSLNMKTVAEGVEIKEQVDFLAKQGCDMIQGYYFAKPMPKDEYEGRMEA